MENYNSSLCHQVSYGANILDELSLQITNIVDVEGTFNVTTLILIIPSTVYNNVGMFLRTHKLAQCVAVDWIHPWLESFTVIHLLQKNSLI